MNILEEIIKKKIKEIDLDKKVISLNEIKKLITKKNFNFKKQLDKFTLQKKIAIIAEVKKASPSKGVFLEKFDHLQIAKEYIKAGAACLSILTEKNYFLGNKQYLKDIKSKPTCQFFAKIFLLIRIKFTKPRC